MLWSKQDFDQTAQTLPRLSYFHIVRLFYTAIFFTPLKIMALSVHVFTKLKFAEQVFVKDACTEFYRNPTDGLVADCMSQTDIFST